MHTETEAETNSGWLHPPQNGEEIKCPPNLAWSKIPSHTEVPLKLTPFIFKGLPHVSVSLA